MISTRVPDDAVQRRSLEERLRQAQKMEIMGRLTSGVAHDFNNILTVMAGYSAMLMCRLSPDDPAYEAAAEIKKASDRATSLTRQLLGFSRKQVVEMQPVHLNVLLTNMDGMLRRLIREDIELIIELDPALGFVQADPGQIEQVIMNLAVNARDAMPTGGMLRIETTSIAIGQHGLHRQGTLRVIPYVRLAVSDTGHGIDTETRLHLFEPFFTTKKLGQGTGLGLSTVHDIVKRSGGTIWVDSQSGHGTTFEIYLPQGETQVEACSSRDPLHASPQGLETILLVEDEEAVRVLIRGILHRYGYTVLGASNGKEALLVSARHLGPIHLLLTDVVMPRMSGYDLARCLPPSRPDTRILYMSGYAGSTHLLQDAQDIGVTFISKPFTPDALARQVRQVLDAP